MSRYLVTLVGRPNVGKSTLFNRIIGRRDAIVHDMPGVTRDRNYAEAEWAGKQFSLVDTGGYVPKSEDVIESAIREQAQIAIEEADVILFIVDANDGVLSTDHELADILRKSEKKVVLVVNKIDGEKKETELSEFYQLGLGEPFSVSALVGRKIGDLLDVVTSGFDSAEQTDTDPRLKIAIIGRPNVGKSSFVNALLKEERHIVTDIPGTTRDPIDAVLKYYGEEILLVDTAGLRRRSRIKESVEFYSTIRTLKSIDRCDVAVVLIDATVGLDHQDLRIIETAVESHRAVLIAVNKWDLIEKDENTARAFEKVLKERLRIYDFIPLVFVSALTKQRVFKIIELAKQIDAEQSKRIATSTLNDLLLDDIKAFPPRSKSGKEIKIKYVTQVKAKPPIFAFFCNEPKLIDDNYRRYLSNRLREHFAFTGVPILLSFKQK
ncbi:MAG: ribosome biogenesis GTPase Der [Ignavibacteriae bacterium]|nr:ribosome biogenesis GTPase Der [Ignavibacteriota bacterium]